MSEDPIDRALAGETTLDPSPEFAARVMRAVRLEAESRAGLPFPWRLAAVPAAVGVAAIVAAAWIPASGGVSAQAAAQSAAVFLRSPLLLAAVLVGGTLAAAWATSRFALGTPSR